MTRKSFDLILGGLTVLAIGASNIWLTLSVVIYLAVFHRRSFERFDEAGLFRAVAAGGLVGTAVIVGATAIGVVVFPAFAGVGSLSAVKEMSTAASGVMALFVLGSGVQSMILAWGVTRVARHLPE